MVPGAVEYVVTTFFEPPRRAGVHDAGAADRAAGDRGREERARRAPGRLLERRPEAARGPALAAACRAASTGCAAARRPTRSTANLEYRPRSNDGFVEDLRTARGVVTGGGFSLLSEAVYLGKPVLSIPLRGPVRAVDERALSGARRIRPLCRGGGRARFCERFLERARRVRAGPVGLRTGGQLGRRWRRSSGSRPRRPAARPQGRAGRGAGAAAGGAREPRGDRRSARPAVGAAGGAIWRGQ